MYSLPFAHHSEVHVWQTLECSHTSQALLDTGKRISDIRAQALDNQQNHFTCCARVVLPNFAPPAKKVDEWSKTKDQDPKLVFLSLVNKHHIPQGSEDSSSELHSTRVFGRLALQRSSKQKDKTRKNA